jgi:hypothetical protein
MRRMSDVLLSAATWFFAAVTLGALFFIIMHIL